MSKCTRLCLLVFLLADTGAVPGAQPRARATSNEGNFIAYADDLAVADVVVLEAERVQQRFFRYFGLKSTRSNVPIVLVVGGFMEKADTDEGVVRIFPRASILKLQVNWDELPIPLESFHRGWVRALCTRHAVEHLFRQTRSDYSKKDWTELRVPIWVTEGMAGLLAESSTEQEIRVRATFLARMEPMLSLNVVLAELEGKFELDSAERALAMVICRALTQDTAVRERFLSNIAWESTMSARDWLEVILANKNLDGWWAMVWEKQAGQFSPLKLGYVPTLRCLPEREIISDFSKQSSSTSPPLNAHDAWLDTVGHPWFRVWAASRRMESNRDKSEMKTSWLRKDVQRRRAAALEWFSTLESSDTRFTRQEWLIWHRLHRDLEKRRRPSGPLGTWFDGVTRLKK